MWLFDYGLAIALAYFLSATGERLLGRRSASMLDWNRAFLAGLAVAASALFPLSLVASSRALDIVAATLGMVGLLRPFWKPLPQPPMPASAPLGCYSKALIGLLLILWLQFTLQNHRLIFLWDGYQIWATKARVLYERGMLAQGLMTAPNSATAALPDCCDGTERVAAYPPVVPLVEALHAKLRHGFDWESLKAVFPLFFLSLLISTYEAARAFVPTTPALAASALLGLVPAVATRHNVGGYADMPQAMYVAAVLAALFGSGGRRAAPWMLGGMLLVKSEGAILFSVACVVIATGWALEGLTQLKEKLRDHAGAIGVAVGCAALRILYLQWFTAKDLTYGPLDQQHMAAAWHRLWDVPLTCARYMLEFMEWGVFWPAFFLAAALVLYRCGKRERSLALAALLSLVCYTGIFYFTNWEFHLHIDQSYNRLLSHLSPAAALVTVIAFWHGAGIPASPPAPNRFPYRLRPNWRVVFAALLCVLAFPAAYFLWSSRPQPPAMQVPAGVPAVGYLNPVNGGNTITPDPDGSIRISGWAACADPASPLAKVEILIDAHPFGEATRSFARPDVAAAFGRPDFTDSGWQAAIPVADLATGKYEITARATCASGDSSMLLPFHLDKR